MKFLSKKISFACLLSLLVVHCFSQTNHLANGGFETSLCCPTDGSEINMPPYCVKPWFNATPGFCDPDYYNVCSSNPGAELPNSWCGDGVPRTGNGCAGFFLYTGGNVTGSEYIEARLIDSLIAGEKYYVTFYIALCTSSKYALDGVGAYFSKDTLSPITSCYFAVQPQIENLAGNVITDTTNWVPISGSFIAAGGEKFITIGNFRDFNNTTFDTTSWGIDSRSYYLIDDVSVIDSGGLEVVEPYEGSSINIYPNPGNGVFTVKNDNIKIISIDVLNVLGGQIYTSTTNSNKVEVDISDKPEGIYFARIRTEKGIAVKKIVVH